MRPFPLPVGERSPPSLLQEGLIPAPSSERAGISPPGRWERWDSSLLVFVRADWNLTFPLSTPPEGGAERRGGDSSSTTGRATYLIQINSR